MIKELSATKNNLADLTMSALRLQINPHFIFNCLNSIKLFTLKNESHLASNYITKFSKLMRLVMDNSRSNKIPLSSELNALQLYIEMEALRFKDKLQYNIDIDTKIETDYIEIPPMLLQPYVENAIWHGLMHKEEGGHIDILINAINENNLLQIDIIDDGVGRKRSIELKSKTATTYKSYGMSVTSERLALINGLYKTGAIVDIYDLFDENNQSKGTKVVIQIPIL